MKKSDIRETGNDAVEQTRTHKVPTVHLRRNPNATQAITIRREALAAMGDIKPTAQRLLIFHR